MTAVRVIGLHLTDWVTVRHRSSSSRVPAHAYRTHRRYTLRAIMNGINGGKRFENYERFPWRSALRVCCSTRETTEERKREKGGFPAVFVILKIRPRGNSLCVPLRVRFRRVKAATSQTMNDGVPCTLCLNSIRRSVCVHHTQ